MIKCLECNKPLKLVIDLKNDDFKCRECGEDYKVELKNKSLIIHKSGKNVIFSLINFPTYGKGISKKTVYELYNNGYVICTKTLNTEFHNHESDWSIDLNDLRIILLNDLNKELQKVEEELSQDSNQDRSKYSCIKCGSVYSMNESLSNNFSCPVCSSSLELVNSNHELNSLKLRKEEINQSVSFLNNGWSATVN